MRGKKGIELSVNFIVMLILAIVLFGFGLYFARELFSASGEITEQAFEKFDKEVENLACATADKVCIPVSTKSTGGGNHVVMAVMVENVLGERRDFQIYAVPSIHVDKTGNEQPFDAAKLLVSPSQANPRIIPLENREKRAIGIAVQPVGVGSGTYAFNVYVDYEDGGGTFTTRGQYTGGRPLKFYVVVP